MNDKNMIKPKIFESHKEVCCGISTRNGGVSPGSLGMNLSFNVGDDEENVRENRWRMFTSLGIPITDVAFTQQVHSSTVIRVDSPGTYPSCDALITNKRGLYCAVSVADCVPVFLLDILNSAVASLHSGWRGSESNIAEKSAIEMMQTFGSDPSSILAYLGPSAGVCCYEVGSDVAERFENRFIRSDNSKLFLDLRMAIASQLLRCGILGENIETSLYCTICDSNLHSYRRDREKSGRMLGVIGIRP